MNETTIIINLSALSDNQIAHLSDRIINNSTLDEDTGCWNWNRHINKKNGYGQMWMGRTVDGGYIWRNAHRVSYLVHKGEVPEGMEVAHKCHNPNCCNPNHLVAATHYDNIQMSVEAGRIVKGTNKPNAKLNDGTVRAIKASAGIEGITLASLARIFDVNLTTIRGVVTGTTWTHVV